jgi:hydroxyacylglutathione hydrolase
MTQVYEDAQVTVELLGPLGSLGNNSYIVRAKDGGPALIIDLPEGVDAVVEALAGAAVGAAVITHQHRDHWQGLDLFRARVDAPISMGPEPRRTEIDADLAELREGAVLRVGGTPVEVIETPGHTPGSICLRLGGVVFTGDTLFPGGPGRTGSPDDLRREIASILERLYPLPADTLVLPGHGGVTTIGTSRAEYDVFVAKSHPSELAGDVLWLES